MKLQSNREITNFLGNNLAQSWRNDVSCHCAKWHVCLSVRVWLFANALGVMVARWGGKRTVKWIGKLLCRSLGNLNGVLHTRVKMLIVFFYCTKYTLLSASF